MFSQFLKYGGNLLYTYLYGAYRPLYFFYKNFSDKDKIVLMEKSIKPGMTVVDIGANIGFYTILFSKLVSSGGKVIALEPEEQNFDHLKKNTEKLDNVLLERAAVGDKDGEIFLYKSDLLNVDHQTFDIGDARNADKVKCYALDSYFQTDAKVDFIKIDIQGYDYFALKGMVELTKRSDGLTILGEIWPYGLVKAGVSAREYLALLRSLGFEVNFFDHIKESDLDLKEKDRYFYTDFYAIKIRK